MPLKMVTYKQRRVSTYGTDDFRLFENVEEKEKQKTIAGYRGAPVRENLSDTSVW
jgi:hypothetical protein